MDTQLAILIFESLTYFVVLPICLFRGVKYSQLLEPKTRGWVISSLFVGGVMFAAMITQVFFLAQNTRAQFAGMDVMFWASAVFASFVFIRCLYALVRE